MGGSSILRKIESELKLATEEGHGAWSGPGAENHRPNQTSSTSQNTFLIPLNGFFLFTLVMIYFSITLCGRMLAARRAWFPNPI
jgi:hypothetical protein